MDGTTDEALSDRGPLFLENVIYIYVKFRLIVMHEQ